MPDLPSGTVTFLFTDIEGSTRLLHELGDTYAEELAKHRRMLREVFAAHGGVEVDMQGDAFFVAFARATEALAAAREGQQALAAGLIRVRMGLHTGEPLGTEEGYVGIDVHRAARIAAAGYGGQILLSQSTRELTAYDSLRDLGEHRLKDLTAPERIYQLGDDDFPPLKSLNQTNLPVQPTPLVGRLHELRQINELLRSSRLLTLTGAGGSGKTRLALQAAAEAVDEFQDGVWFVSLAAVVDAQLVESTIAQVVGARDDLQEFLRGKDLLLLLDNLEQLLPDVAPIVASLGVRILATSRERLNVGGEQEYDVPTLPVDDAVALFTQRARQLRTSFEPDEHVAAIARRLDGLPLALELAAALIKVLTPQQIVARLEQSLALLTAGTRDTPERQRTLRATIEWSYQLLTEEEQRLFAKLGVFAGSFEFEAAGTVAGAELETVAALVDKSLLRQTGDGRFFMLETIRDYAVERLEESTDAEPLRDRHASFFLQLAESAEPELTGADQSRWLERLAHEQENLRTALEQFLAGGEAELALRLAGALVIFWFVRGHYGEGRVWLDRDLADPMPDESPALAKALWGAGLLAGLSDDHDQASALLERGLAVARRVGDLSVLARCLVVLGLLAFFRDELVEARALFEESIDAARRAGDLWCLADALGTLGSICPLQGDLEAAEAAGQEALSIARPAGDQQGVRMALFGLALAALRRGEAERVTHLGGEGLAISREIGDPWFTSYFQWLLGSAALDRGDLAAARSAAEEALEIGLQAGGTLLVVCAREALARVEWAQGNQAAARRQLEDALAAAAPGGVPASYIAAVQLTLGRLLAASGNADSARAHLEASLALATGVGDAWAAERAERALAQAARRSAFKGL